MTLSPQPQYETRLVSPEDVSSRFYEAVHNCRYLEAPCAHRHLTLSQLRNMTHQDTVHRAAVLFVLRELNKVLVELEKGIVREETKISFPVPMFFARHDKQLVTEFRHQLEGFMLFVSYRTVPEAAKHLTVRYRVRPELREEVRRLVQDNGYETREVRFDSRFDELTIV